MVRKNRRKTGAVYEKEAALFLQQKGYEIMEMNFICRRGEIDIVARDGRYLVFIEVKYRHDDKGGLPEEAVGYHKQQKILQTARYYLHYKGLAEDIPCRFDVVGICGRTIRLIRDAF